MTILVLSGLALAAWLYLLFLHGGFWRTDIRLPDAEPLSGAYPPVVAIVPARNEATVISRAVTSIAEQDYPAPLALIVVDDHSSDDTGRIAAEAAPEAMIVSAPARPTGWTGKLWAMECGVREAERRSPGAAYIWFTDADISHAPDELRRLVHHAETATLDLVSLMVRLHCAGFWEGLLIPAFIYFFRMLYPFSRVNDPRARTAAAAGGSMLVRRQALDEAGGLSAIRDALIDDCALARALKRRGRIWLGLTATTRSIRPYAGLSGIWSMVARTAFHQLRYSVPLLVATVAGMGLVYLAPPLIVLSWPLHAEDSAAAMGIAAWMVMTVSYVPVSRLYDRPGMTALLLPAAALVYVLMTLDSARRHWLGRGGAWKSRTHDPRGGSVG